MAGSQSGSIRVWDLEAAKSRPPCLLPLRARHMLPLRSLCAPLLEPQAGGEVSTSPL